MSLKTTTVSNEIPLEKFDLYGEISRLMKGLASMIMFYKGACSTKLLSMLKKI